MNKKTALLVIIAFIGGIVCGGLVYHKYGSVLKKTYLSLKRTFTGRPSSGNVEQYKSGIQIIADFEDENDLEIFEKKSFRFVRTQEYAAHGNFSLQISYPQEDYPGISSVYRTIPEDWSKFKYIKFDIYNPQSDSVQFCFMLKDQNGNGYQKRSDSMFHLSPGWNNLMVDLSQAKRNDGSGKIDTGAIIQYVFCLIKPASETILYLDNIRLEKTQDSEKLNGDISVIVNAAAHGIQVSPLIFGTNLYRANTDTPQVRNLVKNLGLTSLRYPGGEVSGYHWKTGIFDFGTQKPYMFDMVKYDRLVQFCQDTNTQLIIQVNIESGTPQEAAEWVEYNKKIGFYVKYWEIGNEVYGHWEKSHQTPETYAQTLQDYNQAMKAVDPTIKIGADWAGAYFGNFDEIVMNKAGQYIDFLSYHWYPNHTSSKMQYQGKAHPEPLDVAANPFRLPNIVERMKTIIRKECPEKQGKIEFAFLEWDGAWDAPGYDPEPYEQGVMQWSLANALFYAETYAQFMQQGVTVANCFKLQETPYGFIRGHMTEDPTNNVAWDGRTIRPKAFAVQLFRKHFGTKLVNSEIKKSPVYYKDSDWYDSSYSGNVPFVTCIASKNEQNDKLYIMLINRHPSDSLPIHITVNDFSLKKRAKTWKLTGPEITSQNDGAPGTVKITEESLDVPGQNFTYNCPAHSVVSIELDKTLN